MTIGTWAERREKSGNAVAQRRATPVSRRTVCEAPISKLEEIAEALRLHGDADYADAASVIDREIGRRRLRDAGLTDRFWSKVEKQDGCWLWRGCVRSDGYGAIYVGGALHMERAHRVSVYLHTGRFPSGVVLHACDVRLCVNPAHLSVGTQADNVRDMIRKGRGVYPIGTGRKSAKMTDDLVRQMLAEHAAGGVLTKTLAEKYGIHESTAQKIVARKTWRHVEMGR